MRKRSIRYQTEEEKERMREEQRRYLRGLERYRRKGVLIYVDGELSSPADWEKLFEVRDDGMFYMGDYIQSDSGELKEIRFDKVYSK